MADAYTTTATVASDTAAYERLAYFALRPELYFEGCATVKPTRQTHPGSSVQFNIYNDIAPTVATLDETTDVTAVAVSDATVSVTLNEYGNAAITTARVRGTSFLVIEQDVANVIGFNAGISFDSLARNPLVAGTNVRYAVSNTGTDAAGRAAVLQTDVVNGNAVREILAYLTRDNVPRIMNGYYKAFYAPEVAYDLRGATGGANWRDPHTYSQPEQIWNGETGAFEGFSFIETPRLSAVNLETVQGGPGGFVNGGTANVDVFPTIFVGWQALAKTFSSTVSQAQPAVVLGAVVDKLKRLVPIGWYWFGGFGRFREAAIWRLESSTSLAAGV
jgi:N4-gp56 family major capsid protein